MYDDKYIFCNVILKLSKANPFYQKTALFIKHISVYQRAIMFIKGSGHDALDEEVDEREILNLSGDDQWEEIMITIDSDAFDSVGPLTLAPGIPKQETKASRDGVNYHDASGNLLPNKGQRHCPRRLMRAMMPR